MIETQIALLDANRPPMSDAAFDEGLRLLRLEMTSRRRLRPKLLMATAVAAACVIGGVVAVGQHRPADSAAAEVLYNAAERVRTESALHPEHGQFVYQRVDYLNNGQAGTVEYWIPADRGGRETICASDEGCAVMPYEPNGVKNQGLPYDALAALPTTGPAMLEYLRASPITAFQRSSGRTADDAVWQTAQQLGDLFPPAQEAALFEALARLHDVRFEGQVTTFDGRGGVALGIKHPASGDPVVDDQLVFAADTHQYLGVRNVQTFASGAPVFQFGPPHQCRRESRGGSSLGLFLNAQLGVRVCGEANAAGPRHPWVPLARSG